MITYCKLTDGTAVTGVLRQISDTAGERHELFGQRLEWATVGAQVAKELGRTVDITAREAGEITARMRREASRES